MPSHQHCILTDVRTMLQGKEREVEQIEEDVKEEDIFEDASEDLVKSPTTTRSGRLVKPPTRMKDYAVTVTSTKIFDKVEPENFDDAITGRDSKTWRRSLQVWRNTKRGKWLTNHVKGIY